ncbi:response regulator transcription factor [Streptomyces sp. A012304]|uniref:LuxR C-terminal-related transcriptional regulator n=1 Tax=Streptomyces sp. A012304 TaxID=375446 RepID=UPI00222FC68A|nr:response regulator transcription factor [Streptomyces sp. A012304]
MTTVLIVDDQALQRLGYRTLLDAHPDITVIGEAATGAEAARISDELHPDVVLMDIRVPHGIATIGHITRPDARPQPPGQKEERRTPRVLTLSPTDVDEYAFAAIRASALGFLLTNARLDDLTAAIHAVAAGKAVLSPGLTRRLINTLLRDRSVDTPGRPNRLDALTARERDVLIDLASGASNAEIAERLSIASTTVKSHISHILTKTGARDRVQAVVLAYETGLVRSA